MLSYLERTPEQWRHAQRTSRIIELDDFSQFPTSRKSKQTLVARARLGEICKIIFPSAVSPAKRFVSATYVRRRPDFDIPHKVTSIKHTEIIHNNAYSRRTQN